MKIGLYFGSFNPVHTGHLIIAGYMAGFTDLEQVWFIVSPHNPFKEFSTVADAEKRLHLVELAVGTHPKIKVSDVEFSLTRPNYSFETINHLRKKNTDDNFSLILGEDNLESFTRWQNHEAILNEHNLYVYPRKYSSQSALRLHPQVNFIEDAPIIDISSSFLRQAIKEGKDVRYMLPEKIWSYISENKLYR